MTDALVGRLLGVVNDKMFKKISEKINETVLVNRKLLYKWNQDLLKKNFSDLKKDAVVSNAIKKKIDENIGIHVATQEINKEDLENRQKPF